MKLKDKLKYTFLKSFFNTVQGKFYFIDDYFLFTGMGSDGVLLSNKTKVGSIQIKILRIKSFNSPFPKG